MLWILSHPISGPGYSAGTCLADPAQPGFFPATHQARVGSIHFSALGSHDGDRKSGQAQAWLELFRPANTSENEKWGPGQQHHSFEFLLITFSHNFMVENSLTLSSYLLSFLSWSLDLVLQVSSWESRTLKYPALPECPWSWLFLCQGHRSSPPGTPRTPRSQQKSKAPSRHTQLSLLACFLPCCHQSSSTSTTFPSTHQLSNITPLSSSTHTLLPHQCMAPGPQSAHHCSAVHPIPAETWCTLSQTSDLKPLVERGAHVGWGIVDGEPLCACIATIQPESSQKENRGFGLCHNPESSQHSTVQCSSACIWKVLMKCASLSLGWEKCGPWGQVVHRKARGTVLALKSSDWV